MAANRCRLLSNSPDHIHRKTRKQPARLEDLRDVYGLGEAKIEKLGGEILRVVAEHRAD